MEQIRFDEYALVTFYRAENVDDPQTLRDFVRILKKSNTNSVPYTSKNEEEVAGVWALE